MSRDKERVLVKWRNLDSEQDQSGQSGAAFCREQGLPVSHFYYWKERLRQAARPPFVEVQLAKASVEQAAATIEVRLRNGRSLLVAPRFDASHLRALLAVVESEP